MFVLVPAYEPDARLAFLVAALRRGDSDLAVLVVDDGSGPAYASFFADARAAGADVIAHDRNRGKGAALKTGFSWIARADPSADVVTADSDGQHTPDDIARVAAALHSDAGRGESALVLGVRAFHGRVPLRSRLGNLCARGLFRLATGQAITDTQTGLRGIPADRLAWACEIAGDGFEYEQRMLLRLAPDGIDAHEVPIATVYLDRNASSHFRPARDSVRVLVPVLLFAASSVAAFLVDTIMLLALAALGVPLAAAIIAARVMSATVNFFVNRRVVFRSHGRAAAPQAVRYAVLAAALLASNIAWMSYLTSLGVALLVAKMLTEAVLFVLSYGVQRSVVFAATRPERPRSWTTHSTSMARSEETERSVIAGCGALDTVTTTEQGTSR